MEQGTTERGIGRVSAVGDRAETPARDRAIHSVRIEFEDGGYIVHVHQDEPGDVEIGRAPRGKVYESWDRVLEFLGTLGPGGAAPAPAGAEPSMSPPTAPTAPTAPAAPPAPPDAPIQRARPAGRPLGAAPVSASGPRPRPMPPFPPRRPAPRPTAPADEAV